MDLKFATMDLQKYLSEDLADSIIEMNETDRIKTLDIGSLVNSKSMGGQGLQKLRQFQTDIDLKQESLQKAESELE